MRERVKKTRFFEDAILAFGRDGAKILGATIIQSIQESYDRLPFIRPIRGLRVMMGNSEASSGFADFSGGTMDLYVSQTQGYANVRSILPAIIEHESAHIAHGQHNPHFFQGCDARHILFAHAITEGIAGHAVQQMRGYDPSEALTYHHAHADKIINALVDILFRLPEDELPEHYDFLLGDETTPGGNTIGEYVVASMATSGGYSLQELMQLSLDEYEYLMGGDA